MLGCVRTLGEIVKNNEDGGGVAGRYEMKKSFIVVIYSRIKVFIQDGK